MNLRLTAAASVLSTCLFSVVHAECVDDPEGWRDGASGPGYTCDAYALGRWCTTDGEADVGWNQGGAFGWGRIKWKGYDGTDGKKFDEACCACGGGVGEGYTAPVYDHDDYVFTQADKDAERRRRKKKRIAVGKEWVDSSGYSCRVYKSENFCNSDGTVGDGWDRASWGKITNFKNAGRDCFHACEVCGWDGN